jgi:hypothetical protein
MPAKAKQTVYEQVVQVTNVYLGPAAERFIDRQVENHLHIEPAKLTKKDLEKMIDWIRVVVSLLTGEREIIEEYISELRKLTEDPKTKGGKKTHKP